MTKLLVLLQNAYGVEDDFVPSYQHDVFANSHSGKRLSEAIPDGMQVEIRNSNPAVGDTADACFPPDAAYVERQIEEIKPDVILACGVVARSVVEKLQPRSPVVTMPHPAYRALSKQKTSEVKDEIKSYCGRSEISHEAGGR